MAFLSSMNISASALTAQRMRMEIAAENISNMDTTRTEQGGPYRRKMVVLEAKDAGDFRSVMKKVARGGVAKGGVRVAEIVEDETELKMVYDPAHPDADENGYVQMPNVELLKETVDSMAASRAYDANVTAFNTLKTMAAKGLEIGK